MPQAGQAPPEPAGQLLGGRLDAAQVGGPELAQQPDAVGWGQLVDLGRQRVQRRVEVALDVDGAGDVRAGQAEVTGEEIR